MPRFKNRDEACDRDIEQKYGSPDWQRSMVRIDELTGEMTIYTPFVRASGLIRIDKMTDLIRTEEIRL